MTISPRQFITVVLLTCLLLIAGCVMRNSIEVSGGFFKEEVR